MLNVPMDVYTQFNVYKLKYVCTHCRITYPEEEVGVPDYIHLITDSEKAVEFWFHEEFNCHGDIHELLSIELVAEHVSFDMMHYFYEAERREQQ